VTAHLAVILPATLISGTELFIAGIGWNSAQDITKIYDIHYRPIIKSFG
jgi:hypothetical protein